MFFKYSYIFMFVSFHIAIGLMRCDVNLLHIFRKPFPRNTSGWLLLDVENKTREIIAENKLWYTNVELLIVDQIKLGKFSLSIQKKVYVKYGSNS